MREDLALAAVLSMVLVLEAALSIAMKGDTAHRVLLLTVPVLVAALSIAMKGDLALEAALSTAMREDLVLVVALSTVMREDLVPELHDPLLPIHSVQVAVHPTRRLIQRDQQVVTEELAHKEVAAAVAVVALLTVVDKTDPQPGMEADQVVLIALDSMAVPIEAAERVLVVSNGHTSDEQPQSKRNRQVQYPFPHRLW